MMFLLEVCCNWLGRSNNEEINSYLVSARLMTVINRAQFRRATKNPRILFRSCISTTVFCKISLMIVKRRRRNSSCPVKFLRKWLFNLFLYICLVSRMVLILFHLITFKIALNDQIFNCDIEVFFVILRVMDELALAWLGMICIGMVCRSPSPLSRWRHNPPPMFFCCSALSQMNNV